MEGWHFVDQQHLSRNVGLLISSHFHRCCLCWLGCTCIFSFVCCLWNVCIDHSEGESVDPLHMTPKWCALLEGEQLSLACAWNLCHAIRTHFIVAVCAWLHLSTLPGGLPSLSSCDVRATGLSRAAFDDRAGCVTSCVYRTMVRMWQLEGYSFREEEKKKKRFMGL